MAVIKIKVNGLWTEIPALVGPSGTAVIAPEYDELTFPVPAGKVCRYEEKIYSADAAISQAEAWNANHWTEIYVSELIEALQSQVESIDLTALIDDTAGTGDTDLTYSADRISGDLAAIRQDITELENRSSHICTSGEYNAQTGVPTIASPNENILYLVPDANGESGNLFTEWVYANSSWEQVGSASIDLSNYIQKTDMDNAPAAGSNNPVKSSGVKNAIDAVSGQVEVSETEPDHTGNVLWIVKNENMPTVNVPTVTEMNAAINNILEGAHVASITEAWLEENITGNSEIMVDSSLKVRGAAADAKAVGDQLSISVNGGYVENDSLYLTHDGEIVAGPFTGFGGGGSGGGSSSNNAVMSIENISGWAATTIASGGECEISVTWSSIEDEMPTGDGTLRILVNGLARTTRNVAQGTVTTDVSEYLSSGTNTVQIQISDSYGNSRVKNFTVTVLAFSIQSPFDETTLQTGATNFQYTAYGEILKTVYFLVDGVSAGTDVTSESGRPRTYAIPAQTHGSHTLEVYFTAEVNEEEVESNHLHYDVIWLESGESDPIIASSYQTTTVNQYDTVSIPYRVYDPESQVTDVTITIDGDTVSDLTNVDRSLQLFSYRMDDAGSHTIRIICGSVQKSFSLTVNALSIDVRAETAMMALHLTSTGRNNNEANPAVWTYGTGVNAVSATLTGFNWVSDGWQADSDGVTTLRIAGSARVTIPYKLFENDFRQNGKTIEIEFKAHDVTDYDAVILSCLHNGRGLRMTAQQAILRSEQSELSMQYKEDDHIRLTFVVEKRSGNRLMLVYVNAIPSGVIQYDDQDDFSQIVPQDIVIGSSDCAVDIYNIRVYDSDLTRTQVLNNWIADTRVGSVLTERYGKNNVYDEFGNISISKLPGDLPYMILEAPELPQYKGDKKTITGSYTDPVNPAKSFAFTGCQINVQGTSSAPYARKNYDLQFKNGFIMPNGNTAENYLLTDNIVPFNRFVVKADVASSEGANNVELVRLYCETSPYKTREMLADSRVRQGIDGFPIVIFWRNTDTGKTSFLGKYNFNLPKRAPGPYGYSGDMESWEFQNNTSNLMLFRSDYFDETMLADPTTGEEKETWRYDYEARMPSDEWTDYSKLQELQSFVFSTSRDHATGDALDQSVTYGGVTYTNDTADYRLAKFRAEFGNYAEVNSFLFYYIFTELFLMVDSRAKNLFIGFSGSDTDPNLGLTIDRKAVAEPYDMDTALGTNNEGSLVFSYNLEDTDTLTGGDAVFNGQNSVLWNNIRDAFHAEIVAMYQTLRSNGVLSYSNVEARFENHQAKWPEAIWIEDSWFKYIDPLINPDPGKEATDVYLPMMQGSKVEQRRWWLNNRFKYMDSKWNAGDALNQVITLRCYQPANISVTPYADIYATIKYASYLVQQRAPHGTTVTLPCPLDTMDDTEVYIYSAPQVEGIGDLSPLKVGFADFSAATRLQGVKVGDADSEYENHRLNYLSLGTNPLIRYVDARNCVALGTGDQKSVDLSGCTSIEEAYFDGTSVMGVTLPNGGVLKKLHLPGTITNLTVRNQSELNEFVCPNYSNITTLWLENPADVIDTEAILEGMPNGGRVRLFNFHWTVSNLHEIWPLFEKLDTMRGLDQNGNNTNTAQLFGSIHAGLVGQTDLDDLHSRYPDVTITYDTIMPQITYRSADGSEVLAVEPVAYGGSGTILLPGAKESTAQYTYTPTGWSLTSNGSVNANALTNVTADRTVYAVYAASTRSYIVTFVRGAEDGGDTLTSVNIAYGSTAEYPLSTPGTTRGNTYTFIGWSPELGTVTQDATYTAVFRGPVTITYLDYDGTPLGSESIRYNTNARNAPTPTRSSTAQYTYTFAGWSLTANGSANNSNIQLVKNDVTVYAVYTPTVQTYTITFQLASEDGGTTLQSSAVAYGAIPEYVGSTPTTSRPNYTFRAWTPAIVAVTGTATYTATFRSTLAMTRQLITRAIADDVENSIVETVGDYAFYYCTSLTSVSLPEATSVGNNAFQNCSALTSVSLPKATSIHSYAFQSCTSLTSISLPKATSIGNAAFYYCTSLTSVSLPEATSIGGNAFQNCSALETLILGNTEQVATLSNANAFTGANDAIIYVPDTLVSSYKTANNWSTYSSRIKGISELPV